MRGSKRPKQAYSRLQRRCRFHKPRQPCPQRRHRFHSRPKNTTGGTITTPHTTRDETHNTNARPQPPKTGQFTPAKATPVSPPAPTTPAKATPVSQPPKAHSPHDHEAPDSHHRDLSTGLILNARYPQGHDSSFSSHSSRAIIHPSDPYPQLQMVVSNCYLNSSHPSDRHFALLAFMERKCSCIASERTATF